MSKIRLMLLVLPLAEMLGGCSRPPGITQMTVTTQHIAGGIFLADPNAVVSGVTPDPPFPGDFTNITASFTDVTNFRGGLVKQGLILPASWGFTRFPTPNCPRTDLFTATRLGNPATPHLVCGQTFVSLTVLPTTVDFLSPPGVLTITNNQNLFSAIYGMPTVSIYDETETLMSAASANWVSADRNSLTVPLLLRPNMFTGTYAIVVRNVQADASQAITGGASVYVIHNDPPPPPPPPDPAPDPCGRAPCLIVP